MTTTEEQLQQALEQNRALEKKLRVTQHDLAMTRSELNARKQEIEDARGCLKSLTYSDFPVLEHLSDAVILIDSDFRITSLNPAFSQLTDLTLEEEEIELTDALCPDEYSDAFLQAINEAIVTNGNWQGEVCLQNRDGVNRPMFMRISAIKEWTDQVWHYVALFLAPHQAPTSENSQLVKQGLDAAPPANILHQCEDLLQQVLVEINAIQNDLPEEVKSDEPADLESGRLLTRLETLATLIDKDVGAAKQIAHDVGHMVKESEWHEPWEEVAGSLEDLDTKRARSLIDDIMKSLGKK